METVYKNGNRQLAAALIDDNSYAVTLITILLDQYGTEVLNWTPETIRSEVADDFQVSLPSGSLNKIMVAVQLLTSDVFFKDLPTFIRFCNILSGDDFDPRVFDPADASEMAWGITEALLIYPPDEDEPFVEEILAYMSAVMRETGITTAPDILRMASNSALPDVAAEFADDPAMYESFFKLQQDKADAINQMVIEGVDELVRQIESLPLQNSNNKNLRQGDTASAE